MLYKRWCWYFVISQEKFNTNVWYPSYVYARACVRERKREEEKEKKEREGYIYNGRGVKANNKAQDCC